MFLDLSPHAIGIHGLNFEQTVSLAQRHGFGGIDPPVEELAGMPDPRAAAQRLSEAGLSWGGFGLPLDFRKDQATFDQGFARLKQLAPAAQAAGVTRCITWILNGHNERDYQTNFDLHVQRLRPVARLLADHGIRFGIELVGTRTLRNSFKHPFVDSVDGIVQLADAIGSNTGFLLDCFHWYTAGGTPDDITGRMAGRIVYVHVNDARPGRTREQQIDNERALPTDTGVIDLKTFMACLRQVKYDGPIAAEPFLPELGKLTPDESAARVMASLKKLMSL